MFWVNTHVVLVAFRASFFFFCAEIELGNLLFFYYYFFLFHQILNIYVRNNFLDFHNCSIFTKLFTFFFNFRI
jgi:hypothetical protein